MICRSDNKNSPVPGANITGTFKSLPTAEEMLERQLDKGRILANFTVERLASRISQQEGLEIDGGSEGSMIHDIKCELTHGKCKLSTKYIQRQ